MVRVLPTANVSDWLKSVAEVLPLRRQDVSFYTLGEAVAELGDYAQAVDSSNWNSKPARNHRNSIRTEITAQAKATGRQLGAIVAPLLNELRDDANNVAVVAAAGRFHQVWHSEVAVTNAFHDLCATAKIPGTTSYALRKMSVILASQVGPDEHGNFSLLRHAADALVSTEVDLGRSRSAELPDPLTEAQRLEMATDILVSAPAGRVVVWTAYLRATVSNTREAIGPLTFLRANWALPTDSEPELYDFPECAELLEIREDVSWLDDLNAEARESGKQLCLVRVDLGEKQVAGAAEVALRRIEAVLSVAVGAGGISWQNAGSVSVLLDGKVRSTSHNPSTRGIPAQGDDHYGIAATAEILSNVADQLGDALAKGPMPENLVEALASLREARMTDHREVLLYGARRVTPRVATALEDHAMELFASVLRVSARELASTIQHGEALRQADRRIIEQLWAPFNDAWSRGPHESRQTLERTISTHSENGVLLVSVAKAVARQDEIRALPMSNLQRGDLEEALAIYSDPTRERQLLEEMVRETEVLRARHRRVRNAVNHGLPLHETTLNSIRNYGVHTSSTALNIVLTWFKNGDSGSTLLRREKDVWTRRMNRISQGKSCATEDAESGQNL